MNHRAITLHISDQDEITLIGTWPEYTYLSARMVTDEVTNHEAVWYDGGRIYFRLANGEAVYRDTGVALPEDPKYHLWELERLEI